MKLLRQSKLQLIFRRKASIIPTPKLRNASIFQRPTPKFVSELFKNDQISFEEANTSDLTSILTNVLEESKKKRNDFQNQNAALALHRYVKMSQNDDDTTLTLPILSKIWQQLSVDEIVVGVWSLEITAKLLNVLGNLNRKSNSSSIRRIINREDIRMMERNFVLNEFKLTPKYITRACFGLMRLQLWNEIESDDYPSKEFSSGLKLYLNQQLNETIETFDCYSLVKFSSYFGNIVSCLSSMSLIADNEIVRLMNVLLKNMSEILQHNDGLITRDVVDVVEKTSDESRVVETEQKVSLYRSQQDALSSASRGLSACCSAMMNWKLFANGKDNENLWNFWFRCCDEILMRGDINASSNDADPNYFDRLNETRLITSMIVSANWFNNEQEFLELLDRVESCLLRLAPSFNSHTANFLLLQMKTLENKMKYSKNQLRYYDTFREEVWQALRQRAR